MSAKIKAKKALEFVGNVGHTGFNFGLPMVGDLITWARNPRRTSYLKSAGWGSLTAIGFIGAAEYSKHFGDNSIGTLNHANHKLADKYDIKNLDGIVTYAILALIACWIVRAMVLRIDAATRIGESAYSETDKSYIKKGCNQKMTLAGILGSSASSNFWSSKVGSTDISGQEEGTHTFNKETSHILSESEVNEEEDHDSTCKV